MAAGMEAWNTSELLAACCGATVKVWSPISEEPRKEARINEGTNVHALDWSSNNKVLAVAGDKAQITMVGGGRVIGYVPEAVEANLSGITALRFSADSKKMAIGCANRTLHIRDLRSQGGGNKCLFDHKAAVCALAINPGDTAVASASAAGQILLHDFKSGAKLATLVGDGPLCMALSFCPQDGDLLAASSDDGGVAVWSVKALAPRHEMRRLHRGGTTGVRFAPDNPNVLYTCGSDMRVLVLDTRQQQQQQEVLTLHAPHPLTCMDARFDARMLAAGTNAGSVLHFDLRRPDQTVNTFSFVDRAPVGCVRWQHPPHASKAKVSAAASAAVTAAPAVAGAQQGRLGGGAAATAGAAPGTGVAAGARAAGGTAVGSIPAVRGASSTATASRGMSPDLSHNSDLGLDTFTRAVSPVRLDDSAADHTPSGPGRSLDGATTATPADSAASGMAAFMVTPGVGVTRGLGAADGGATPISRLAPFPPAGPGAGPGQAAGAAAGAAGGRPALFNGTQRLNSGEVLPPTPVAAVTAPTGPKPAGGVAAGASRYAAGAASASAGGASATAAPGAPPPAGPPRAASTTGRRPAAPDSGAGGRGLGAGSRSSSNAAAAAVDAAAAAALDGLGGASSRPWTGSAGVGGGAGTAALGLALREDVFKGFIDQQMALVRQDVRNLHLEVLQQFHQAQMDLMSVVEGLAQRQEAISQRLEALGQQAQELADTRGLAPGMGMSMAWM